MNIKLKAALYTLICVVVVVALFFFLHWITTTDWGWMLGVGIIALAIIFGIYMAWYGILTDNQR